MKRLSELANALFAGAEAPKVLGGLRRYICEQLHGDTASRSAANCNIDCATRMKVQVNLRITTWPPGVNRKKDVQTRLRAHINQS
jgi:hypothetical protein